MLKFEDLIRDGFEIITYFRMGAGDLEVTVRKDHLNYRRIFQANIVTNGKLSPIVEDHFCKEMVDRWFESKFGDIDDFERLRVNFPQIERISRQSNIVWMATIGGANYWFDRSENFTSEKLCKCVLDLLRAQYHINLIKNRKKEEDRKTPNEIRIENGLPPYQFPKSRNFYFKIIDDRVPKIELGGEDIHIATLTYNWVTKRDKIVGMSANTAIVSGYLRSRGNNILIFKLDFNTMTYEEL